MPKIPTPIPKPKNYSSLVKEWEHCKRCRLCDVRRKVVIAKGTLPCDILFIGEAPGESEDVIGKPFVGPAGKLLDDMIRVASNEVKPSLAFTNLVGCIPKDGDTRRKNVEPLPDEIKACWPRLEQLIKLASPDFIVAVGTLAEKQAKLQNWQQYSKVESIPHPVFLIRMEETRQGLEIQRATYKLRSIFKDLIPF